MNEETILALGEFSNELLRAEPFQLLTKLYAQQCAADMLDAKDSTEREKIHAAYRGFDDFLALTKKFANDYIAHLPCTTDQPEVTDDPAVHDIYDGMN